MSRRRGFSLLEALFAMLMMALVLGAVTYVLQQSVAVGGSVDELGTWTEVSSCFSLLRDDLAGALSVAASPTAQGDVLSLSAVNATDPLAERIKAGGDLFGANHRVTMNYQLSQGSLTRTTFNAASQLTETRSLLACSAFQASLGANRILNVQVSITHRRVTRSFNLTFRVRL